MQRMISTVTMLYIKWTALVAQLVKNPPAMQETWVRSLGQEDPLEKEVEKSTHSSALAWKIPWTEKPGRLKSKSMEHWERLTGSKTSVPKGA